jgi:hypothetical protein
MVKMMENTIKELTLLLIYFTSWQEDAGTVKIQRSWKGYPFVIWMNYKKKVIFPEVKGQNRFF